MPGGAEEPQKKGGAGGWEGGRGPGWRSAVFMRVRQIRFFLLGCLVSWLKMPQGNGVLGTGRWRGRWHSRRLGRGAVPTCGGLSPVWSEAQTPGPQG